MSENVEKPQLTSETGPVASSVLLSMLSSLNDLQLTAVTSPTSEPLQIRAGPGTGKTKVLVARVAYLLLHKRISPQNIIVTTFTRKAAREMVERLTHLLGGTDAAPEKLLIGTFHSIGYRVIQKYGALEGLVGFAVAGDNDASQAIESVFAHDITDAEWAQIARMPPADLAPFVTRASDPADPAKAASSETHAERLKLDRKKLLRHISKLKSRALFPDDYARLSGRNILLSLVYTKYQHRLYTHRLLDFDDCLLYCHRIVTRHPVLRFVQHTLVDEFQDTNEIQLQLMYQFAARGTKTKPRYCVTIVGDQDQSIYAFRDAQARNFDLMLQHYRDNHSLHCRTVNLTQNYRSTADILRLSEHVMRQQKQRPRKDLVSQLLHTLRPVKAVLSSADEEARWVAHQVESLAALPSRPLGYAEMAVLVRSAYQTRVLESEFVRRKIPYAIVKGRAFWERKEVTFVLDYLRCVADDHDWLALFRCINSKRGVGPVAVAELERICEQQAGVRRVQEDIAVQLAARAPRVSAPALCFDILQKVGLREIKTSLGVKVLGAVKEFVGTIQETRLLLERGFDGPELRAEVVGQAFDHLLVRTRLDKEFCADENQMLILHEVRSQLVLFLIPESEESLPDYTDTESAKQPHEVIGITDESEDDTVKMADDGISDRAGASDPNPGQTLIRQFLTLVVLYETDSAAEQGADVPKVAISTIHGAKGLEWPVVFVPGVSEGLLPASFALTGEEEAVNEERRCFYVAATRAKLLLFVSAYTETAGGLKWGRPPIERPSRFLDDSEPFFLDTSFNSENALRTLYLMLEKPLDSFCFDTYREKFTRRLNTYVRQITDTDGRPGFVSSLEVHDSGWTPSRWPVKRPGNPDNRAPVYAQKRAAHSPFKPVVVRNADNLNQNADSGKQSASRTGLGPIPPLGRLKAPAYIPERANRQRRLGTR